MGLVYMERRPVVDNDPGWLCIDAAASLTNPALSQKGKLVKKELLSALTWVFPS